MSDPERFIAVPGGKVYLHAWRPAAGRTRPRAPILLLHDSLGSVALWRDFPQALADACGRTVYAYDRLGFGRSSRRDARPSRRFIQEEAEQIVPLLRTALGSAHVVLFGHSVGGSMALAAAAALGAACEAVITEAAQACVEARTQSGIRAAIAGFAAPGQLERLARWHEGDVRKARWMLDAWSGVWLDPAFADWSLETVLPRVGCPVLALHGDRDDYGSDAFPRAIVRGVTGPAEWHLLRDCGHVPHREQPALLLGHVSRWLDRSHARAMLCSAWRAVGADGAGEVVIDALLDTWSEPQRAYHTLQHLGECLDWLALPAVRAQALEPAEITLALGWHDAVYDVHRHDNEQRSAAQAAQVLGAAGVASARIARIVDLILATRHASAPRTRDEALLVDIDLSILGAEPSRFTEYDQQIRLEYNHVPEADYRRARQHVLAQFRERPELFHTPWFRDRLAAQARANLAGAISRLTAADA